MAFPTGQEQLDGANSGNLPLNILGIGVKVGSFLRTFTSVQSEDVTVDGTDASLTRTPLHSSLRVSVTATGAMRGQTNGPTVPVGAFSVDGKDLLFNVADDTVEMTCTYLTLEHAGADADTASLTDAMLTGEFPDVP